MDTIGPEQRSWTMAQVRGKDTSPERRVRSLLHRLGFRFRLNRRSLPGAPDIVLPKHRAVVLVHGCFWHQHPGCKRSRIPVANRGYWEAKLKRNTQRDALVLDQLKSLGWSPIIVWECELRDMGQLEQRLVSALRRGTGEGRNA